MSLSEKTDKNNKSSFVYFGLGLCAALALDLGARELFPDFFNKNILPEKDVRAEEIRQCASGKLCEKVDNFIIKKGLGANEKDGVITQNLKNVATYVVGPIMFAVLSPEYNAVYQECEKTIPPTP